MAISFTALSNTTPKSDRPYVREGDLLHFLVTYDVVSADSNRHEYYVDTYVSNTQDMQGRWRPRVYIYWDTGSESYADYGSCLYPHRECELYSKQAQCTAALYVRDNWWRILREAAFK